MNGPIRSRKPGAPGQLDAAPIAIQLFVGNSYMAEYKVERLYRDARDMPGCLLWQFFLHVYFRYLEVQVADCRRVLPGQRIYPLPAQ